MGLGAESCVFRQTDAAPAAMCCNGVVHNTHGYQRHATHHLRPPNTGNPEETERAAIASGNRVDDPAEDADGVNPFRVDHQQSRGELGGWGVHLFHSIS